MLSLLFPWAPALRPHILVLAHFHLSTELPMVCLEFRGMMDAVLELVFLAVVLTSLLMFLILMQTVQRQSEIQLELRQNSSEFSTKVPFAAIEEPRQQPPLRRFVLQFFDTFYVISFSWCFYKLLSWWIWLTRKLYSVACCYRFIYFSLREKKR